jgi:hypothetical protein
MINRMKLFEVRFFSLSLRSIDRTEIVGVFVVECQQENNLMKNYNKNKRTDKYLWTFQRNKIP